MVTKDYKNKEGNDSQSCLTTTNFILLSLPYFLSSLGSFVGNKGNKQWIWLALDTRTREIVGFYLGDRGEEGARGLRNSLPGVYRQCSVAYTDFWSAYGTVFPFCRHKAVGKETGKTNYIERFNNTLRQRVSRLARETRSFSKKLENHIGAIW